MKHEAATHRSTQRQRIELETVNMHRERARELEAYKDKLQHLARGVLGSRSAGQSSAESLPPLRTSISSGGSRGDCNQGQVPVTRRRRSPSLQDQEPKQGVEHGRQKEGRLELKVGEVHKQRGSLQLHQRRKEGMEEASACEESKYHLKHVSQIEKIQNEQKEKRFQEEKLARRMARRRKLLRERALSSMSLPKNLERFRPEKPEHSKAGATPAEEVVEDPAVEAARLAKAATLRRERNKKHRQYLSALMRARKEKKDRDKEGLREAQEARARLKQSILGAAARLREAKILARKSSMSNAECFTAPETTDRERVGLARPRRPRSLPTSASAERTSNRVTLASSAPVKNKALARSSKAHEEGEEEKEEKCKSEEEEEEEEGNEQANVLQSIEHISSELQARLMGSKGKTTRATMESWDMSKFRAYHKLGASTPIFIIKGGYPDLKRALKGRGWFHNKNRNSDHYTFKWTTKSKDIDHKTARPGVMLNHFSRSASITTKCGIVHSLQEAEAHTGYPVAGFFPRCYDISIAEGLGDFMIDFKRTKAQAILTSALAAAGLTPSVLRCQAQKRTTAQANSFLYSNNDGSSKGVDESERIAELEQRAEAEDAAELALANDILSSCAIKTVPLNVGIVKIALSIIERMSPYYVDDNLDRWQPKATASFCVTDAEWNMLRHFQGATDILDAREVYSSAPEGQAVSSENRKRPSTGVRLAQALKPLLRSPANDQVWSALTTGSDGSRSSSSSSKRQRRRIGESSEETVLKWKEEECARLAPLGAELALRLCKAIAWLVWSPSSQFWLNGWAGRNVWILKPAGKSRGRGISCIQSLTEVEKYVKAGAESESTRQWVAQKYMENSMIIHKRKFDIRQWVLVTCWNPLRVYFYTQSYLRFCVSEYTLENLSDKFVHLANNSISKKSKKFYETPIEGSMWHSEDFREYLLQQHGEDVWQKKISPKMEEIVALSLMSIQDKADPKANDDCCFEMYGYDFMVDSDCNPFLIEVNSSPAMDYSTEITKGLVKSVFPDLVSVLLDHENFKAHKARKKSTAPDKVGSMIGLFKLIVKRDKIDREVGIANSEVAVKGVAIKPKPNRRRRSSSRLFPASPARAVRAHRDDVTAAGAPRSVAGNANDRVRRSNKKRTASAAPPKVAKSKPKSRSRPALGSNTNTMERERSPGSGALSRPTARPGSRSAEPARMMRSGIRAVASIAARAKIAAAAEAKKKQLMLMKKKAFIPVPVAMVNVVL